MNPNANLFYSLLLFVSGGISLVVMSVALKRRQRVSCALPIAAFSFTNAIWGLTYAIYWTGFYRPNEYFWLDMTYFGVVFNSTTFFIFVLCYSGWRERLSKRNIFLLSIIPVMTLFFLWTDSWLGYFFAGKRQYGDSIIYDGGVGFWLFISYTYVLILISILIIFQVLFRYPKKYRGQTGMILLGVSFPIAVNLFSFLGFFLMPGLDLTPVAFSLTGLFFSIAIFRYDFLDLMPISRDFIFETHQDIIFILDTKKRIIDANQRSKEILKFEDTSLLGRSFEEIGKYFPEAPTPTFDLEEERFKFRLRGLHTHFFEMIVCPMKERNGLFGGYILTIRDITVQEEADLQLMAANQQLKTQLSEIEELQEKLREEAIRDHLTGLYNRRYLHEVLSHALPLAERENSKISFALLDIDYFKQVNDNYGHAIGDEVLISLSNFLMRNVRKEDTLCRFGGEEFFVVFLGTSQLDASRRTEEWRKKFGESSPVSTDLDIKVTFSAGIASFPEDGEGMDMLFKVADHRLYLAKEAGRNRVYDWRNNLKS